MNEQIDKQLKNNIVHQQQYYYYTIYILKIYDVYKMCS